MRRLAAYAAALLLCMATPAIAEWAPHDTSQSPDDLPRLSQDVRVRALAALDAADAQDFDEAQRLAAQTGLDLLEKVVRWAALTRPEEGGDFDRSAAFIRANPDWPWQWNLRRQAERALTGLESPEALAAWFEAHPPLTYEGLMANAQALSALGRRDAALQLLKQAWLSEDFSGPQEAALRRYLRGQLSRTEEIARLDRLLWDRREQAARRQAARLGGPYPALAEARIALAFMRPGVDGRIAALPREFRDDPGFVYERARWRQRKGRYEDVIELLDPPRPGLANAAAWWPVRHWAARRALDRGDVSVAYRIASGHGLQAGIGFADGEWLAGWIKLRFLSEPAQARTHFERMYGGVSTPVSRARGAYWAGRAAEASGDRDAAETWYRHAADHATTFYGQLAADRLNQPITAGLWTDYAPSKAARAAYRSQELAEVVRLMAAIGSEDWLEPFVIQLRRLAKTKDDHALLAELMKGIGRPDLAVHVARAARAEGYILPLHLFPLPAIARPVLADAEAQRQPEPALILSLMRQESGFNPEAISRAGARGLMQLMPATARRVAGKLDVDYSRRKLLHEPGYNMALGEAYMAELIERFDGSILLAVAAYNAGPTNVRNWLSAYGDPRTQWVDPIDWIESIPLPETRNYVQRVLETLPIYRQRLTATQVAERVLPELQTNTTR